jgi:hypothetical protein
MNSELEQTVQLLQEYVVRLPIISEVKPVVKIQTKETQVTEVNKKQVMEQAPVLENKETHIHNDDHNSYLFHITRDKGFLYHVEWRGCIQVSEDKIRDRKRNKNWCS